MNKIISMLVALVMVIGCCTACVNTPPTVESPVPTASEQNLVVTAVPTTQETEAPVVTPDDEPVYGGTLNVSLNRTVSAKSLDPLYVDSTTADQIMQNFGDTLVQTNSDASAFLPSIATDWTISDDGLVYTFTIRDDVYFHPGTYQDGRLMTAEDVAYSVTRAKDYWCNYLYFLDYVEVVDEHTVAAHLLEPNATFLYQLTSSSVIMVPKEEVEGWGEEFGMHMVGTGPFMVKEHVPDQYTILVKNPKYWGVEPYLDSIKYFIITDSAQNINALMTGEIDVSLTISGEGITQVQNSDNLSIYQAPEARVAYVGFNSSKEFLSDPNVRKALVMAVDTEQLSVGAFNHGDATYSRLPVPVISWGYDQAIEDLLPDYDPEGAKALLTEAGYGNGFTLKMNVGSDERFVRAATILQAYWAAVGVNLEITPVSQAEMTASYLDNTVVTWVGGQGGSPDPATFVGYMLSTEKLNTNYNSFHYSDPATDELLAQGMRETNMNKRIEIYKQLNTIAAEYNLGIFFGTMNLTWGVSNNVHGLVQENKAVMRVCGLEGSGINIWKAK